jgi:predicted dehydrogenase
MNKVGLAIIGTRGIGIRHAEAALAAGGAEITACAAKTKESAQLFAKKYDVPFATTNYLSIARIKDVDAVVICTPNRYHAPYTLAMLRSGKDVLLEKPMTVNTQEARTIAKSAKKYKRVVMVGHMWRFDPEVNFIKHVVASGMIGRPVKSHAYGVHVGWGPGGWFVQKRLAGGGALADMGIHAIDTVRYILGDPEPKSVYATVGTHYGDYDVDDTGVIMIKWSDGSVSTIECGWRQPHSDRPYAGTQIYGAKGYAAVFPTEVKLSTAGSPGEFTPTMPHRSKHNQQLIYDAQMIHFLFCVRKRMEPMPGINEGLVNMRIVDAAYTSSKTGKAVKP